MYQTTIRNKKKYKYSENYVIDSECEEYALSKNC